MFLVAFFLAIVSTYVEGAIVDISLRMDILIRVAKVYSRNDEDIGTDEVAIRTTAVFASQSTKVCKNYNFDDTVDRTVLNVPDYTILDESEALPSDHNLLAYRPPTFTVAIEGWEDDTDPVCSRNTGDDAYEIDTHTITCDTDEGSRQDLAWYYTGPSSAFGALLRCEWERTGPRAATTFSVSAGDTLVTPILGAGQDLQFRGLALADGALLSVSSQTSSNHYNQLTYTRIRVGSAPDIRGTIRLVLTNYVPSSRTVESFSVNFLTSDSGDYSQVAPSSVECQLDPAIDQEYNAICELSGNRRYIDVTVYLVTPNPTPKPTRNPTRNPTVQPTRNPTQRPTMEPTLSPTAAPPTPSPPSAPPPTPNPTGAPTNSPTVRPTQAPTPPPATVAPTPQPTIDPAAFGCRLPQATNYEIAARLDDSSCLVNNSATLFRADSLVGADGADGDILLASYVQQADGGLYVPVGGADAHPGTTPLRSSYVALNGGYLLLALSYDFDFTLYTPPFSVPVVITPDFSVADAMTDIDVSHPAGTPAGLCLRADRSSLGVAGTVNNLTVTVTLERDPTGACALDPGTGPLEPGDDPSESAGIQPTDEESPLTPLAIALIVIAAVCCCLALLACCWTRRRQGQSATFVSTTQNTFGDAELRSAGSATASHRSRSRTGGGARSNAPASRKSRNGLQSSGEYGSFPLSSDDGTGYASLHMPVAASTYDDIQLARVGVVGVQTSGGTVGKMMPPPSVGGDYSSPPSVSHDYAVAKPRVPSPLPSAGSISAGASASYTQEYGPLEPPAPAHRGRKSARSARSGKSLRGSDGVESSLRASDGIAVSRATAGGRGGPSGRSLAASLDDDHFYPPTY